MASLKKIECLYDGRFSISQTELFDNELNKSYPFPVGRFLSDLFVTNVEGLPEERVNALLLYALSLKPIMHIKDETLLSPVSGIKIVSGGEPFVIAGRFSYVFTQPIPHAFHSTYFHVCGVSEIIIHTDGTIRHVSSGEITPSKNQGNLVHVMTDEGGLMNIHPALLMAYAFASDQEVGSLDDIHFIDGNVDNWALDNLVFGKTVVSGTVTDRIDTDPIYLETK